MLLLFSAALENLSQRIDPSNTTSYPADETKVNHLNSPIKNFYIRNPMLKFIPN